MIKAEAYTGEMKVLIEIPLLIKIHFKTNLPKLRYTLSCSGPSLNYNWITSHGYHMLMVACLDTMIGELAFQ